MKTTIILTFLTLLPLSLAAPGPIPPDAHPKTKLRERIRNLRLSLDRELLTLARLEASSTSTSTSVHQTAAETLLDEDDGFTEVVNDGTGIFRPILPGVRTPAANEFPESSPNPEETDGPIPQTSQPEPPSETPGPVDVTATPVPPPVDVTETPIPPPVDVTETPIPPPVDVTETPVPPPVEVTETPVVNPTLMPETPVPTPVEELETPIPDVTEGVATPIPTIPAETPLPLPTEDFVDPGFPTQGPTRTPEVFPSVMPEPTITPEVVATPLPSGTFGPFPPLPESTDELIVPVPTSDVEISMSPGIIIDPVGTTPTPEEPTVVSPEVEATDPGAVPTDDDEPVCFPADATVELEGGVVKRMEQVQLGDRVRVGPAEWSEVFMFTHKLDQVRSRFVKIDTASGHSLELTRGHYLYVNGEVVPAKTAKVGDTLMLADHTLTEVKGVDEVVKRGLYNPQTVHGDIVVEGVRATTYTTAVERRMAHALLAPIRAMYSGVGWTLAAFEGGADRLASLVPSGSVF